jgi:hypothetical protein
MLHWRRSFVTDGNAALVEQFLNITLAEGKSPEGILDHAQRETMAVRFAVRHGRATYRASLATTPMLDKSPI